jgi:hypothetical protein
MRDHYQQQEQIHAQAMADRNEWEQATAGPRSLAIAADAELRRRHPHQKIEPLRSGEPAAVSDTGREQASPGRDEKLTERVTRIRDLAAQRQASRAEMDEHPGLMVPSEDPVWGELGDAAPNSRTSGPDAILQPPRPEIIPSRDSYRSPPSTTANPTAKPRTDQTDAMRRNHQRAMRKRRNRRTTSPPLQPFVTICNHRASRSWLKQLQNADYARLAIALKLIYG